MYYEKENVLGPSSSGLTVSDLEELYSLDDENDDSEWLNLMNELRNEGIDVDNYFDPS